MGESTQFDDAYAYLVGLYGENPNGLIWIGGQADGFKGSTFTGPLGAAKYAIELDNRGGLGVYHRSTTLAVRPERRGATEDSAAVFYFALDFDVKGPGHKAEDLPESLSDLNRLIENADFPAPTAVVSSGGGYYPQWRFAEPIDVRGQEQRDWVADAFALISEHFIAVAGELGWQLDNVRDLARVFRLPGTTNRKAEPVIAAQLHPDNGERFDLGVLASIANRRKPRGVTAPAAPTTPTTTDDLFDDASRVFTEEQAKAFIRREREKLAGTTSGFNAAINAFAMACAHFPWLVSRAQCGKHMIMALGPKTGWTEPDRDDIATIESAYSATEAGRSWVAVKRETSEVQVPDRRLYIEAPAEMAYWLQENAGKGRMSGFFSRGGQMVHTPRVDEAGYVAAPEGENGPVEIRPVTGPVLAAKLQYLYDCYKMADVKDEAGKKTGEKVEVAALFPVESARRAVDAPEALGGLRSLRGITSTPMVRADGCLIDVPGYDESSGYLFLPDDGVKVPTVTGQEVEQARKLLLDMVQDFPFATVDDRANYLGLLLTPLLRQIVSPSYKLFGIGAHQPGSGKSLLAEIAGIIHGSVMRSEVPEDEAEWRKQTFSILATTSAPLVVLDNIMGVLKSSTLAGVLTAGREITDRELGTSRTITVANDRVWVVTGNNLSIGGDLVRRTVTILIDPDQPDPEKRTDFAIQDLAGWVTANRNEVLWALLTLILAWVAEGMPEPERKQSDSFARWSRVIAGILEVAGIGGAFDAESGKRVARGGDDDGLAQVLDLLHGRFDGQAFTVAEALEPKVEEGWLIEQRDWLPSSVLDKLGRSEAAGRKAFGWWFRNRNGRWVTTAEGRSMVIREAGTHHKAAMWRIEVR